MEIDTTINISILISACLAILGWMVNNYFKRRHEIAKKRLEYRLEALHSFIPAVEEIKSLLATGKENNPNLIKESHIKFQLYGTKKENEIFNKMVEFGKNNEFKKVSTQAENLIGIVLAEIRNELKLPKLK